MNYEYLINRISMVSLIAGGMFFIYEGVTYMNMKRDNPDKVPDKIYAAGVFTILLGIVSIAFGALHFWVPTKDT